MKQSEAPVPHCGLLNGQSVRVFLGLEIAELCLYLISSYRLPRWVKKLPAMQETWLQSLGWENSLEEGMATHLVSLPLQGQRSLAGYSP